MGHFPHYLPLAHGTLASPDKNLCPPPKSITQCSPHETKMHWHVVSPFVEECAWLLIETWCHVKVVAVNYRQALKCLWEIGTHRDLLLHTHLRPPVLCQIKPNLGQKMKPTLFVNIANK